MFLRQLSLSNFRNYLGLELELRSPITLFQGDNGQGKSNLLESIYFLATTRSPRSSADRELVNWGAFEETVPFARVAGTVEKAKGELRVEIIVRADRAEHPGTLLPEGGGAVGTLSKRIKINGVVKRALDLIGLVNVVMFSPQDLDLVAGSPALRRRYLDITNCQVDPRYCRALQQYNRVLLQRNHLLKQIRDRQQPTETLEFWDEELVKSGAYLLSRRRAAVAAMNNRIDHYYHKVTGTGRRLKMAYRPSVEESLAGGQPLAADAVADTESTDTGRQMELFRDALRRLRRREVLQGMSLVGPHRDDLIFRADGIDMNVYGSRGEQRVVALALKLAEVEFMESASGERPILLLDDVMSELDPSRRLLLMETLGEAGQILVTATELHPFTQHFLGRAARFLIEGGKVYPLVHPAKQSYNQGCEA